MEHSPMGTSPLAASANAPMELRPLTLGEILDRTAQLYRTHFLLFAGITIFPSLVLLLMAVVQIALIRMLGSNSTQLTKGVVLTIGGAFIGGLVYAVLLGVSLAATNRAVSDIYLGQPATIGGAYRQVRPHWFRYIWLMLVAAVYSWAPGMVLFSLIIAGTSVATVFRPVGSTYPMGIILVVIAVVSAFLVVPFGIWMTLRYSLSVPASIFEDLRIHASLKRSVFLTKGGRGRIFVLLLLVIVISVVLSMAIQFPLVIIGALVAKHTGSPLLTLIGTQLGSFIVQVLLGPVYGIAITLFYYDARIRKEGFDIDWLMRRANLMPGVPPQAFESNPALAPSPQIIPESLSPPAAEPDVR